MKWNTCSSEKFCPVTDIVRVQEMPPVGPFIGFSCWMCSVSLIVFWLIELNQVADRSSNSQKNAVFDG